MISPGNITDDQLMQSLLEGDNDSLKVLFERYSGQIYGFLFKMCQEKDLSMDLTQDAFFQVFKYRHTYKPGSFKPWLYAIARNMLAAHYKKGARLPVTHDLAGVAAKGTEGDKDYTALYEAMSKLSEADRELLTMNKINGVKFRELAIIYRANEGTMKTRVSRALARLKKVYFDDLDYE